MTDESKIIYGGPEPEFIGKVKSLGGFILQELTKNSESNGLVCTKIKLINSRNYKKKKFFCNNLDRSKYRFHFKNI